MQTLPIFYKKHTTKPIVVVGGGEDASRKMRLLLRLHTSIVVMAPHINDELHTYVQQGRIQHCPAQPTLQHLQGAHMIFGASDDDQINRCVSQWARQLAIPVNVVDTPELSDFLIGAVVDRSPLTIGICSNGSAPILVRNTRSFLESILDENLGKLAMFADTFRNAVKIKFANSTHRKRFWEQFFNGTIASLFLQGHKHSAWQKTIQLLNSPDATMSSAGAVGAVGAVHHICLPKNTADALTIGDIRHLQLADIIVYNATLDPHIFEYFRRDAVRYTEQQYSTLSQKPCADGKLCTITCADIDNKQNPPIAAVSSF